jgi:hypothetical protein
MDFNGSSASKTALQLYEYLKDMAADYGRKTARFK